VIAFPKTRQAIDPTMRAPAPVAPDQLDTIHIQATTPEDEVAIAERRGI
jgi:aspartyl-tRNA synthetase